MADEEKSKNDGSAKGVYSSLSAGRNAYLQRAWDCAELTLPYVLPRDGVTGTTTLPTPWQSLGARGVNNLASKLLMAVLPPNMSFFRMKIDEVVLNKMLAEAGEESENFKTHLDSGLAAYEKSVMSEIEVAGDRVSAFEMLKHLLITGNVLLHDSGMGLRVYHLDHYVVRRDPSGNPLEIIAFEQIDPDVLPEGIRSAIREESKDKSEGNNHKPVDLYTRIVRGDDHWKINQEVNGVLIPHTMGTYPLDKCPWIALRFTKIDGEDYGRGYVEEYLGDFRSMEDLCQSLVEGAKAAAKMIVLVKPGGSTRLATLQKAKNGDINIGNADEVSVVQSEKAQDFSVAQKEKQDIQQRLEFAFLLNSAVQRNGDRVTAEEIRFMAQELESTLGGFYTILAHEFQLPYVKSKIVTMSKQGRLPALPKGVVRPSIVTGLDAMGRNNDKMKLLAFVQEITQAFGPEITAEYMNVSEAITRLATADSIDTKGLINTQEQVSQTRQAKQRQEMISKLGPAGIQAGGKIAQERMKNGQAGTTPVGGPTTPNG